jgi:Cu2+-exporting ATPase
MEMKGHEGHKGNHHGHMVADFRRRFWIPLIFTIPVLILSPMIQEFFGIEGISFRGHEYILFLRLNGRN